MYTRRPSNETPIVSATCSNDGNVPNDKPNTEGLLIVATSTIMEEDSNVDKFEKLMTYFECVMRADVEHHDIKRLAKEVEKQLSYMIMGLNTINCNTLIIAKQPFGTEILPNIASAFSFVGCTTVPSSTMGFAELIAYSMIRNRDRPKQSTLCTELPDITMKIAAVLANSHILQDLGIALINCSMFIPNSHAESVYYKSLFTQLICDIELLANESRQVTQQYICIGKDSYEVVTDALRLTDAIIRSEERVGDGTVYERLKPRVNRVPFNMLNKEDLCCECDGKCYTVA